MAEDKEDIHQKIITGCILGLNRLGMHPVFLLLHLPLKYDIIKWKRR